MDHCGYWKSDKHQQDTYANVTIPYIDARVASKLCKGETITYQHVDGSGITDDWILEHVIPNMQNYLECEVCIVFGHALLWRIFMQCDLVGSSMNK